MRASGSLLVWVVNGDIDGAIRSAQAQEQK